MKYRKKPVVVEAFQMTKERRWDNSEWPQWLHEAWNLSLTKVNALFCVMGGEALYIQTLEGVHEITFDDFIIQGIQGELYPCKPNIFEASYEVV